MVFRLVQFFRLGRVSLGIQTAAGVQTVPLTFDIEAADIHKAFAKFEDVAKRETERAKDEIQNQIQELRRQVQSRIVVPGQIAPGDMGKLKL